MENSVWETGDTCFVITNKKKRQAAEYKVLSFDGRYYFLESRTAGSHINASPSRMFRSKEAAAASLG